MDLDKLLADIIDELRNQAHQYNYMLKYRSPQDPECLRQDGRVKGLLGLLKAVGCPFQVCGATIKTEYGYGRRPTGIGCFIIKSVSDETIQEALKLNYFEHDIYWLVEGNSELMNYKRRKPWV